MRRHGCAPRVPRAARWAHSGEEGVVAGLEALAFGTLVFVFGTLIMFNGWTVVDAKLAVEGAAREATRAVVEAAPLDGAGEAGGYYQGIATSAAQQVLTGMRGPSLSGTPVVTGGLGRGECVRVTLQVQVPLVRLPLVGATGGTRTVVGTHAERVDPFRSGLDEADAVQLETPCPA